MLPPVGRHVQLHLLGSIFASVYLTTHMGWSQGSTCTARCCRPQCRTHCTASLERSVYSSGRVLCYRCDSASFLRCSTCLQILVYGKTAAHSFVSGYNLRRKQQKIDKEFGCAKNLELVLTWGRYIPSPLTEHLFHRSWSSETRYSTVPSLHSRSLGVYPRSHTLPRCTTEGENDRKDHPNNHFLPPGQMKLKRQQDNATGIIYLLWSTASAIDR